MQYETININTKVIECMSTSKRTKDLYTYAVATYITAGRSSVNVEEFKETLMHVCDISRRTANRWVDKLLLNNFIKIRKSKVRVKTQRHLDVLFKADKAYIPFGPDELFSYDNFKTYIIQQFAILKQKRMAYAIKNSKVGYTDNLRQTGKIETLLAVVDSSKAGCSISKLEKSLGFDKKAISQALKGCTQKQVNWTRPIKGVQARKEWGDLLNGIAGFKITPAGNKVSVPSDQRFVKMCFEYEKESDTYKIGYLLASKIIIKSEVLKRNYKVSKNFQ